MPYEEGATACLKDKLFDNLLVLWMCQRFLCQCNLRLILHYVGAFLRSTRKMYIKVCVNLVQKDLVRGLL